MTVFEKLQQKIDNELGLDLYNFRRTNAGKLLRREGGWTWVAENADGEEYGSPYPAVDLVEKGAVLVLKDRTIYLDE